MKNMFQSQIIEPFLKSIQKFSDRNAFCINEDFFTYKHLEESIAKIRFQLADNKDDIIGLIANDDFETYASIFALWLEGKAYTPLEPTAPAERNQIIIEQANIKTILDSSDNLQLVENAKTISTKDLKSAEFIYQNLSPKKINDKKNAYILFTSGSTGTPKGVPITRENLAYFVESFWKTGYDIDQTDRCLQMFELTFDLSIMSYLIPLLKGACIYTIPKNRIKYSYIFELMDEHELTVALMVPSMLNYLRPYFDEIDCPKMKYSMFCGESLYKSITDEWAKCIPNAKIDNVYGPTEDTIFCTVYTYNKNGVNETKNDVLSIGKAMYNNYIDVFDEENNIVNTNEIGELCLSGKQLTSGYINNEKLNQEKFFFKELSGKKIRFYRTGDLCIRNHSGNFDFIGRKDSQVKIQGYRIELGEVEHYCREFLKEINIITIPFDNNVNNTEIALFIETNEKKVVIDEVKKYLYSKLPAYMVPTRYYFVPKFPVNNSDKIDRVKLKNYVE
jgi:amino acid adenylation domain-containing protein